MKTLRLLLWLRWKLFLNSGTAKARWVSALVAVVLFVALSPFWAGGAALAYIGVDRAGAPAVLVTFAVCQFVWLWMGLVSGALGRTFELDKFLRFPVSPRSVFTINVIATLLEPMSLMTAPALGAVALAVGQRAGVVAAIAAACAALLLSLLTALVLQVLLALLDELLRREATRYAAGLVLPLMFFGMQFAARATVQDSARWLQANHMDPARALETVANALTFVPTVSAPAALATGALEGDPVRALAGAAGALAMLVLGVLPAAALMRHVVRAGESAGGAPRATVRTRAADRFALFSPPLRPELGALLAREVRYTFAHPQRVASMISLPLMVIVLSVTGRGQPSSSPAFVLMMLVFTVGMSSMMLFAYDGAGVRSLFLLPCRPRDLVLSKNLEFLARIAVELVLVGAVAAFLMPLTRGPEQAPMLLAGVGVLFGSLVVGTSVGIRFPTRARRRGSGMRGGPGFFQTLGLFLATALIAALGFGTVWLAAHRLAAPAALAVAWTLAGFWALAGTALWWRSLDVHAELVREYRERIITEAGRSDVE
ncbi:MAG: hypothetical protein U0704_05920 [Candidatus Eisenbacteria bacterium]